MVGRLRFGVAILDELIELLLNCLLEVSKLLCKDESLNYWLSPAQIQLQLVRWRQGD